MPTEYVVVGEREWTVLQEEGILRQPYPRSVSAAEYGAYLDVCRLLTDQADCDMWGLYRALWRLWKQRHA